MHDSNTVIKGKTWKCGTLNYTRASLAALFFWLLWGDFCYMMMESVTPSIMPFKFKALHASNTEMGLIIGTIPQIIYSTLNPVISFRSDRFRSRWGRRIPFILASLPFLVMSLIGLAFGDRLGILFRNSLGSLGRGVSPNTAAIVTLAMLLAVFTFFNTFVTSVFWYLFNDVVPEHLLARFMSWFRMISMLSAAFYNFCIFRFAKTHAEMILVGAAVLYFFGFGCMCLYVKEGQYPPAQHYLDGKTGPISAIKTFVRESHSNKIYWYQWMISFISSIGAGMSVVGFMLFFYQSTGMNMAQIGDIIGSTNIATSILILGSGWLADLYHPLRVVIAGLIVSIVLVSPATMIWLVWHPAAQVAFWVWIVIGVGLMAPAAALAGVYDPPLLMRLFPRSNYGQFCSVNAVWRSAGGILGGLFAGMFLDAITHLVGKQKAYLYVPVWGLIFSIPTLVLLLKLFGAWKSHGGDEAYIAPLPKGDLPLVNEAIASKVI